MRVFILSSCSVFGVSLQVLVLAACSDSDQAVVGDTLGGDIRLPDGLAPDSSTPDSLGSDTAEPGDTDTSAPDTLSDTTPEETMQPADVTQPPFDTADQQICIPGVYVCTSINLRSQCAADGKGYTEPTPCGDDESCRNGVCTPRCPNDPKFGVYVGCEFWATDLPNYPDPTLNPTPENLPWALVVSNPGTETVRVGFEMPPLFSYTPPDDAVPGGQSRTFQLPNINVQGTSLMPKGVYVVATGPVLVHQFNPWDNRFSNDASMLLPVPLLGTEYVILSWETSPLDQVQIPGFPTPPNQNGYFTVIAAYPNTTVQFTVTAHVRASGAIPQLNPGNTHTVRMNRGDVLSVQADPINLFSRADISGSIVRADKPIAVFGGHEQAVIGDEVEVMGESGPQMQSPCCADHLEEQMLPIALLSDRYIAVKSPPRGTSRIEDDFWRIQAAADNVTVTTNPPQPGADNVTLAKKGDYITVKSNQSFEVVGTGKLQVGQYLTSRDTTQDFTGDASLVLMVPSDRHRRDYAFSVPANYTRLRVALVRQAGDAITIDGHPVTASFTPVAATGWEVGYAEVAAGYHVASSTQRFGLYVYGFNNAVSFSYIGGLAGPGE